MINLVKASKNKFMHFYKDSKINRSFVGVSAKIIVFLS